MNLQFTLHGTLNTVALHVHSQPGDGLEGIVVLERTHQEWLLRSVELDLRLGMDTRLASMCGRSTDPCTADGDTGDDATPPALPLLAT